MTVCIAAMAREYIVSVSDTMVSGSVISSDGTFRKEEHLEGGWSIMMAGNDLTQAAPVIAKASEYLKGKHKLSDVVAGVKRAVQERITEVATDRYLARFGLDMTTFLKSGKKQFGPITFNGLCAEIKTVNLNELELLIYGFEDRYKPHIFVVRGQGEDSNYDKIGYAVIGSGCYAADTLLTFFNQSRSKSLDESTASVCAAKFLAERSGGVGRETNIFVAQHGKQTFRYRAGFIDQLREEWESNGIPRISPKAIQIVQWGDIKCLTHEEILEDLRDLESTRGDPTPPQPSPEKP